MMRRRLIALILVLVACAAPAATTRAQDDTTRRRVVDRQVVVERRSAAQASGQARQRRPDERDAQTERIARTVNIGASGELDLANIAGDILVSRGSGTTAAIEIVKTARAATAEEAREMLALVPVEITERGTRTEVRTRYPAGDESRRNGRRNLNVSVAYTVAAPEGTRLLVKSISGNISVRDILGGLTLESVSGSVRIANAGRTVSGRSISGDIELNDTKVEGALEAGTISGTVRLRRLSARSVTLNSVSGNVDMQDVTAERMGAQSVSGNITYDGNLQPTGRYELASHSGSIRLTIPAASAFELEATSFSGAINTDIPVTMSGGHSGRRRSALRGTAGGGGAFLDLTTFSGSIVILKR